MADIKLVYAASGALTFTSLASLEASSTWVAGANATAVDNNTTNKYLDYLISGIIKTATTSFAAGYAYIYVAAMLDDTTWPDTITGSDATVTISSAAVRDQVLKLGAVVNLASANTAYGFAPFSVANLFGGICPAKFTIFVAQSTVALLASSGSSITQKGVYQDVV